MNKVGSFGHELTDGLQPIRWVLAGMMSGLEVVLETPCKERLTDRIR